MKVAEFKNNHKAALPPPQYFHPKQCPACKHMYGMDGLESRHLFCRAENYFGLRFCTFEDGTRIEDGSICFNQESE